MDEFQLAILQSLEDLNNNIKSFSALFEQKMTELANEIPAPGYDSSDTRDICKSLNNICTVLSP